MGQYGFASPGGIREFQASPAPGCLFVRDFDEPAGFSIDARDVVGHIPDREVFVVLAEPQRRAARPWRRRVGWRYGHRARQVDPGTVSVEADPGGVNRSDAQGVGPRIRPELVVVSSGIDEKRVGDDRVTIHAELLPSAQIDVVPRSVSVVDNCESRVSIVPCEVQVPVEERRLDGGLVLLMAGLPGKFGAQDGARRKAERVDPGQVVEAPAA